MKIKNLGVLVLVQGIVLGLGACGQPDSNSPNSGQTYSQQSGSGPSNPNSGQPIPPPPGRSYAPVTSMSGVWVSICTPSPAGSTTPYMTRSFDFDQRRLVYKGYQDANCNTQQGGSGTLSASFSFGTHSDSGTAFTYSCGMSLTNSKINGLFFKATPGGNTTLQMLDSMFRLSEDSSVTYSQ